MQPKISKNVYYITYNDGMELNGAFFPTEDDLTMTSCAQCVGRCNTQSREDRPGNNELATWVFLCIGQVRTLCECHLYTAKLVPVGADIDFLHKAEKLSACMVYAYTACDYVYIAAGNDARKIKTCRCTRMHVISLVCMYVCMYDIQNVACWCRKYRNVHCVSENEKQ